MNDTTPAPTTANETASPPRRGRLHGFARWLAITAGVIGIIAGGVVLFWPGITLLALAYVSGIWLIVLGILQIVLAFRVRKVSNAADLQQVITS